MLTFANVADVHNLVLTGSRRIARVRKTNGGFGDVEVYDAARIGLRVAVRVSNCRYPVRVGRSDSAGRS